ncbi:MAG: hypothetical protein K8J08_09030 [Thermoanaerobaculia bacterium]|nr:hypothetical protein [Thermoanaerobaculia bacterium]
MESTGHARLIREGWQRRFVAGGARIEEAIESYSQMGFEVLAQPVEREDLSPQCHSCESPLCPSYRLIYTRRPLSEGGIE